MAADSSNIVNYLKDLRLYTGDPGEAAPSTDTGRAGLNGRLKRIAQNITSLGALFPSTLGQKTSANSLPVVLSTEQEAEIGSLTETAPATDTASSGLNGRLQRIAQRLTSLIAFFRLGQGTMAQSLAVTIASDQSSIPVAGDVASAASDSGNPIKIGGLAKTSDPTAVTDGQRVNALYTKLGKQVIMPYTITENFVSGATSDITNTAATTIIAGVASNNLYITHMIITNSHASVGTFVNITEETSGTILYTVYAAPAGGGASITLPVPLKVPTAAKALQATCVTTGANVRVSASGYKSA